MTKWVVSDLTSMACIRLGLDVASVSKVGLCLDWICLSQPARAMNTPTKLQKGQSMFKTWLTMAYHVGTQSNIWHFSSPSFLCSPDLLLLQRVFRSGNMSPSQPEKHLIPTNHTRKKRRRRKLRKDALFFSLELIN